MINIQGLALCSRFAFPPNSLSLCGPEKQIDLKWYTETLQIDLGVKNILSQFSTLYPYLCLIAYENNIADPFDTRVVEAYWLGNSLLSKIGIKPFINHLSDKLVLKKKIKKTDLSKIFLKVEKGALPNHAFHVLNIYKRTGRIESLHTVQTMDACIINWGKITTLKGNKIVISTKPLTLSNNLLTLGQTRLRTLLIQGEKDTKQKELHEGDWVSYHWGYFCEKLNLRQLKNLIHYTKASIDLANKNA